MKKILITGASGFIGRHCLPLLVNKGNEIHATYSKERPKSLHGVHWHQVDLLDIEQVERFVANIRPEQILHMAWYAEPGKFWNAYENLQWVRSCISLLDAAAREGCQRIVMAGSCAEYDWKYSYLSEELTPLSPATLYGTCKNAINALLSAFAKQAGFSAAWGRIFFLYGPYENPLRLTSYVIRSLLKNESALCSPGDQIRDFLFVEDVASAFVTLLESEVTGEVNICSGHPVSIKEIITQIATQLEKIDLIQFGALPPVNEPSLLVGDNKRLSNEVNWKPAVDLKSGIETTINWWKHQIK